MNYRIFLFIFCFIKIIFLKLSSQSFLYPVAYDKENNLIYIIHQKNINDLNLWLWSPNKKLLQKALLSNFMPGGIKIIPKKNAFSFIDQGKVRIKGLIKRSPKSIDFSEPICDIGSVEWLNDEDFYFSARKNKNFIICKYNIKDAKIDIIAEKDVDCIYPRIVQNDLFYIERDFHSEFRTNKSNYKVMKKNLETQKEVITLDKNTSSIAFLFMKSSVEGFYLEHPNFIDRNENIINFTYGHFLFKNDKWEDEELFSFKLPFSLIFGSNNNRLFESILPLLPKYYDDKILFSSIDEDDSLNIYSFNLINKIKCKMTDAKKDQIYFSPVIVDDVYYYGSSLNSYDFEFNDDLCEGDIILPFFKNEIGNKI